MLHPEPVHLAGELVAEFFEQVLAQELLLRRLEGRALLNQISQNWDKSHVRRVPALPTRSRCTGSEARFQR
jgi:hypothetical protein